MNLLRRIQQDANGARILADWVGKGREPVERQLAQARADVCAACPHNRPGGKIESGIAQAILEQEGLRAQIGEPLGNEGKLKSCDRCGCYLKLKVWVPMRHLRPRSRLRDFPEHCWMRTENPAPRTVLPGSTTSQAVDVVVRRQNAMGDAIMASSVCTALHRMGVRAGFLTAPGLREIFQNHPHLSLVSEPGDRLIDMDGAWERLPNRAKVNRRDEYLRVAKNQSSVLGIHIEDNTLPVPLLEVTNAERSEAAIETMMLPRPLIGIVPGSDRYENRSIADNVWLEFANRLQVGEPLWLGKRMAPNPIQWIPPRSLRHLMALISQCDVVISADTGPLHMAIALEKPTVAIVGPFTAASMLPPYGRWTALQAPVHCIGCGEFQCPLEGKQKNACTRPSPADMVRLVEHLLPWHA